MELSFSAVIGSLVRMLDLATRKCSQFELQLHPFDSHFIAGLPLPYGHLFSLSMIHYLPFLDRSVHHNAEIAYSCFHALQVTLIFESTRAPNICPLMPR